MVDAVVASAIGGGKRRPPHRALPCTPANTTPAAPPERAAFVLAVIGTLLYLRSARRTEELSSEKAEVAMRRIEQDHKRKQKLAELRGQRVATPRAGNRVALTDAYADESVATGDLSIDIDLRSTTKTTAAESSVGARTPRSAELRRRERQRRKDRRDHERRKKAREVARREKARAIRARARSSKSKRSSHGSDSGAGDADTAGPAGATGKAHSPRRLTAAERETERRAAEWRVLLSDLDIPEEHGTLLFENRIKVSDLDAMTGEELAFLVPNEASRGKLQRIVEQFLAAV